MKITRKPKNDWHYVGQPGEPPFENGAGNLKK